MTAVGLSLLITACAFQDPDGEGAQIIDTTIQYATSIGRPSSTTSSTAASTTTAIPTSTTEAPVAGTRSNPLEPGTTVQIGDWEVTYVGATVDATELVIAENQFNEPPAEGRQFVFLQLQGAYVGEDSGNWFVDINVSILGSANNTFGGSLDDYCGVIPDSIDDTNETFPGGTVAGNECLSVRSDQIEGSLVIVEESFAIGDADRTFFTLIP